uniref:Uncharacterized protein n=1 Tax=Arundo donax TaxID=35708 RepID=A0A0A8ZNX9_ARUDO
MALRIGCCARSLTSTCLLRRQG